MKSNTPKYWGFFFIILTKKYNNILVKNHLLVFENGWNGLERNIGVKYIGERNIKFVDLIFFAQFSPIK